MPGPSADDRLQAEARKLAEPTLGIGAYRHQRPNLKVGTDRSTEGIEAHAHPGENRSPGWLGNHRSDKAYSVQLGPETIADSGTDELVRMETAAAVSDVKLQGCTTGRSLRMSNRGEWQEQQNRHETSAETSHRCGLDRAGLGHTSASGRATSLVSVRQINRCLRSESQS